MRREQIIQIIQTTLRKHRVKEAYLFGSFARGEKKYHDIDIAITPPKRFSLLDMTGMQIELQDAVSKKIDLVSLRSIKPAFKPYIRKDLAAIL